MPKEQFFASLLARVRTMRGYWWVLVGAFIVLLSVWGVILLWPEEEVVDVAWERVQSTGELRVGVDASYPPFEDVGPDGELVGFDIDLANEIGRRLGAEVVFLNMGYDGLFDAVVVGQVDVLISALVAGPEQLGKVEYTIPYFNAGEFLVVLRDSPVQAMVDLEGRTLAVEYGSGGDLEARAWERRLASFGIERYPDPNVAVEAVIVGEVDAALVDGISARLAVGAHPELELGENVTEYLFAAAVSPDSDELHEQLDAIIWEMIQDGTVDRLIDDWFGAVARE